jgi:septal ring factor EnvC (AmiA/AmiB activator)
MMRKIKISLTSVRRPALLACIAVLLLSLLPRINQPAQALTPSELQAQIGNLQEEIAANQAKVEDLAAQADTLKAKISEYQIQIANTQNKIDLTNLKIEKLERQIVAAEKDLEHQKGILAESLRELYKRGNITTVELLASSDSYSDFISQQEYLSRLKDGIQESAQKVQALKDQLEDDQKDQKNLKEELEGQRQVLDSQRAEQQQLLDETEGQESEYQALVESLKKQQREAENALIAALGSGSYKAAPIGPVDAGEIIGNIGSSGLSSGPHLHLEVRVNSAVTNPGPYIQYQPVSPLIITQSYGNPDPIYYSGYHPGIDYAPGSGAISAIAPGYLYRGCSNDMLGTSNNAYGYAAIVDHGGGVISIYSHMSGGPPACNYNTYY